MHERMKYRTMPLIALLLTACSYLPTKGGDDDCDSTQMTRTLTERGRMLLEQHDADSALTVLLNAADYSTGSHDHPANYRLYALISQQYEAKNLSEQQQQFQQRMLVEAQAAGNAQWQSEAYGRMAVTDMVAGLSDRAATHAKTAYELARKDTLDYRAQTLLLLCQIYLQQERTDSARYYLDESELVSPQVTATDLYRLSHVYVLAGEGRQSELEALVKRYLPACNVYTRAEMLRLQLSVYEDAGRWQAALSSSKQLTALTDSIAAEESSASMTRIHELQHEQQMKLMDERQQLQLATERSRHYRLTTVVLGLLLAASMAGLFYRRRALRAHARELEAMRLAEQAQAGEEQLRMENVQLQKVYYERLFAIFLPILNACRGRSGHINLEEDSWALIERNTDMVLPGFTSRLRRQHPTLSEEDVRFCCLIMMRVPNTILADIYGIAPSSVAMRKQRMKKKFDDIMHEQTLENYLNQYGI